MDKKSTEDDKGMEKRAVVHSPKEKEAAEKARQDAKELRKKLARE